jgi:hypothetical protein
VAAAQAYTREQYLACAFLSGSDRKRYGKLLEDLENDYTVKQDNYPRTLVDTYSLLIHWKQKPRDLMRALVMAFANVDEEKKERRRPGRRPPRVKPDKSDIQCYRCKVMGHYSNECPELEEEES